MYKTFIRPLLFRMNPERAHAFTFSCLKALQKMPFGLALASLFFRKKDPRLEREVFGIKFPSPVGVAAGLDKDAEVPDALGALGFSYEEIGTLTPQPHPRNPSPRLFRLPEDKALINRMGFNNQGAKAAAGRLAKRRTRVIVGGNIGKNKVTPNAQATSDYLKCYDALYPYVDYFAVNVSSPNTPGLRELQDKEPLEALLTALQKKNASMPAAKPVLLKIAPDLTDDQLDDIIEIVGNTGIAGVIATNTTVSREMILSTRADKVEAMGAGGLSGMPLSERSTEVIRYLHERSGGRFPIIGVGGIMSPDDALEKLDAGASLVQVYTGFIYEGPAFVKSINKAILKASKEA